MTVIALPANQPETFYRGAGRIAGFRGHGVPDRPEDWVASTTSRFGLGPSGITTLPDGRLLTEAIAADRRWWLGPERADSGILVKLLDAGQRLPVHVHPDRAFAHEHLASPYGKTEAWVIVSAEPDAVVHLGFARDVSPGELAAWVRDQEVDAMLAATNRVPIRAGDALLCPARMPHAIGAGIGDGIAGNALIAGIASVLVSVLVLCFGTIGSGESWGGWVAGAFTLLAVLIGGGAVAVGLVAARQIRRSGADGRLRFTGRGTAVAGISCGAAGAGIALLSLLLTLVLQFS